MSAVLNVVQAETFKLLRKRRVYVLAGLWWVLLPVLALVVARVLMTNLGASFANEVGGIDAVVQTFASPYGLSLIGVAGPANTSPNFFVVAIAAIAAVLVGEERSHHMWKTVLVAQPSRVAVMAGKLIVAMLALGALMAGALASGVLFGALGTTFLPTTFAGAWGTLATTYLLQWAFSVALVAFAFLMIHLARNLAVGVILVFFLPGFLETLYTIYAAVVGFQPINRFNVFLQTIRLRQLLEDLPTYFFTANVFAPARQPIRSLISDFTAATGPGAAEFGNLLGANVSVERAGWVVLGYTALCLALLAWRFLRADVD